MRIALDTNVLAYAEGVNGARLKKAAVAIVEKLPRESTLIPVQALGELFHVLTRKAGRSPQKAREAILSWQDTFGQIETSPQVLVSAMDAATDHAISFWDAVIVSAAAAAGCRVLLSEDMQSGFTWSGVTVVNPFAEPRHELIAGLLAE